MRLLITAIVGFLLLVGFAGCSKQAKPKKKENFEESKYCMVVTQGERG